MLSCELLLGKHLCGLPGKTCFPKSMVYNQSRSPRNGNYPVFREAKQNSSMPTSMISELPGCLSVVKVTEELVFLFILQGRGEKIETGINKEMNKVGGANTSLPCWKCGGGHVI